MSHKPKSKKVTQAVASKTTQDKGKSQAAKELVEALHGYKQIRS